MWCFASSISFCLKSEQFCLWSRVTVSRPGSLKKYVCRKIFPYGYSLKIHIHNIYPYMCGFSGSREDSEDSSSAKIQVNCGKGSLWCLLWTSLLQPILSWLCHLCLLKSLLVWLQGARTLGSSLVKKADWKEGQGDIMRKNTANLSPGCC